MKQVEIADLSGYERDNIRLLCMDDVEREELRARRRRGVPTVTLGDNAELVEQMQRTLDDPSSRVRRGRPKRKDV